MATTPTAVAPAVAPTVGLAGSYAPVTIYPSAPISASTWPLTTTSAAPPPFLYQPETFGNEFSVLTDFLETLDDGSFFTPPATVVPSSLMSSASFGPTAAASAPSPVNVTALNPTEIVAAAAALQQQIQGSVQPQQGHGQDSTSTAVAAAQTSPGRSSEAASIILPAATKTERFLLTAADQEPGSRDERLTRVIRSKYEAGLLKPYNYVKGYSRLSRWMDSNVSQESKQQILQPLSVLRPKFRAVAQSLRDIDLVFIEEAFERMLLDYDRVFSAMGVPACLWRRTGEIYKGNREFCELIGLDGAMMRDGRVCIYELMAEESAVNYWEKYGHVAFDSSQKAVLTSCVLRYKPALTVDVGINDGGEKPEEKFSPKAVTPAEERFVNCCFSFTIRRDKWGIPSMIVGNFIAC